MKRKMSAGHERIRKILDLLHIGNVKNGDIRCVVLSSDHSIYLMNVENPIFDVRIYHDGVTFGTNGKGEPGLYIKVLEPSWVVKTVVKTEINESLEKTQTEEVREVFYTEDFGILRLFFRLVEFSPRFKDGSATVDVLMEEARSILFIDEE